MQRNARYTQPECQTTGPRNGSHSWRSAVGLLSCKDRIPGNGMWHPRLENLLIIVRTDLIVCMQSKHLWYSTVSCCSVSSLWRQREISQMR